MPIYEYAPEDGKKACDFCRDGFEAKQSMSEAPLEKCPECGAPVKRTIFPVGIATNKPSKKLLSDQNLKKHGFTKLVNEGEGKFRKI